MRSLGHVIKLRTSSRRGLTMSAASELAAFRRVALNYPFSRDFGSQPILIAAWIDASVHGLPCSSAGFSPELTAAIVKHLKSRGCSEASIAAGFAKTRNAFSTPVLLSVGDLVAQRNAAPTMRASTRAEQQRNMKYTLEILKQQHWLASGDLIAQKRIEKAAIDLVMGFGEAVQMRSSLHSMQQENLGNIRMWRNQVTYPRAARAR